MKKVFLKHSTIGEFKILTNNPSDLTKIISELEYKKAKTKQNLSIITDPGHDVPTLEEILRKRSISINSSGMAYFSLAMDSNEFQAISKPR